MAQHQLCGIGIASGFEQVEQAQMILDVAPPSIGVVLCRQRPKAPFAAARRFAYVGADTVPFL